MNFDLVRDSIRTIPDFPKPGIMFRDISPLLQDSKAFQEAVEWHCKQIEELKEVDVIVVIESRGFIFGSAVASHMKLGLALIRKAGKLPYKIDQVEYELEYGTSKVEIHVDAIQKGDRVVIIDDLLATGGTAGAAAKLIEKRGALLKGAVFLIELETLKGRENLKHVPKENIKTMLKY